MDRLTGRLTNKWCLKIVLMSALGQKRTSKRGTLMSALPSKEDVVQHDRDVRFVPEGDQERRKPVFSLLNSGFER